MVQLTKELLQDNFLYENGSLFWKISKPGLRAGTKAGGINSNGYSAITLNGFRYLEHRLIFLMLKGYLPSFIDHINLNRLDNRIENLREATKSQNNYNTGLRKDNKTGVKNVSWHKGNNRWVVTVRVNGHKKHIGSFADLELADLVAIEARDKYHKEFAKHE